MQVLVLWRGKYNMRCIKAATKHQGVSFPDSRDGVGEGDQPADAAQASQAQKNKFNDSKIP